MITFKNTRTRNTCVLRDKRKNGGDISIICYNRLSHNVETIAVDHIVSSDRHFIDLANEEVISEVVNNMTRESYFSTVPFHKVKCTLDQTKVNPSVVFAARVLRVGYGFIDGVFKMMVSFEGTDYVYATPVNDDVKSPPNPFGMYMVVDKRGVVRFYVERKFNMYFEYV